RLDRIDRDGGGSEPSNPRPSPFGVVASTKSCPVADRLRIASTRGSRLKQRFRMGIYVLFAGLFALGVLSNSAVVKGVRYFWLDDDQMISMRYARNLAHGHGLTWNPGEYVEGYTNFLWTVIM